MDVVASLNRSRPGQCVDSAVPAGLLLFFSDRFPALKCWAIFEGGPTEFVRDRRDACPTTLRDGEAVSDQASLLKCLVETITECLRHMTVPKGDISKKVPVPVDSP